MSKTENSMASSLDRIKLIENHEAPILQDILMSHDIYFVNYKNSSAGTGGVGTVTREMLKIAPNMHFIYNDKSGGVAPKNSFNIRLEQSLEKALHTQYSKLYLWPILHGLEPSIKETDVEDIRPLLESAYQKFAEGAIASTKNHDAKPIYWVNDYILTGVVGILRKLSPASTIIFSWRTPFGAQEIPKLPTTDKIGMLESLLEADLITFHRKNDLDNFVSLIEYTLPNLPIVKVNDSLNHVLRTHHKTQLLVVPMGSNPDYRKELAISPKSELIKKHYLEIKGPMKLITNISRFEESKGIEYEIDCIESLLELNPKLKKRFVFIRFSYFSKEKAGTDHYIKFYKKINDKIESINNKFGDESWKPILGFLNNKLTDYEVTGLLRATDILFIGSHADGFNHLAIEGVVGRRKNDPPVQLILGNIGARDYLKGHLPIDTTSVENGVYALIKAIGHDSETTEANFKSLKRSASSLSVGSWINTILKSSIQTTNIENQG